MIASLSAFDLDGTLLRGNCSFAFSFYLYKKKVFSLCDLAYCILLFMRFKTRLISLRQMHEKSFKRLFWNKDHRIFTQHIESFLDEKLEQMLYPPVVEKLKKSLPHAAILSSSPSFLVEAIAKRLGVSEVHATEYHVEEDGRLSEIRHLMEGYLKAETLKSMNAKVSVAYTDDDVDLPFLQAATRAVVVCPTRRLLKIAKQHGWERL